MESDQFYYLASYPKSGNTWCRLFISYLKIKYQETDNKLYSSSKNIKNFNINTDLETGSIMSCRYWFDDLLGISSSDLTFEEIDNIRTNIKYKRPINQYSICFHKIHDSFNSKEFPQKPIVPLDGCLGIVYLIRHPADVSVSFAEFRSWSLDKSVDFLLNEDASLCDSRSKGEIQLRQFLGTWSHHVSSWIEQKQKRILVVRYEDLMQKPVYEFGKIAEFLGFPNDPIIIEEIVGHISFSKLKEMEEKQGFLEHSGLSKAFFRSGKIGEGKQKLDSKNLEKLKKRFRKYMNLFNYKI